MKTKKKGLFAALSVTLASAILVSASAAGLVYKGQEGDVEYKSEKVKLVYTPSYANVGPNNGLGDGVEVDTLNKTAIIPKEYTGGTHAIYAMSTDRGENQPGPIAMGDGIVIAWDIKANEDDLKDVDETTTLFTFDNKFNWNGGGHEDATLEFKVKDYKDAPKDEKTGMGTFVMKMTDEVWKDLLMAPSDITDVSFIECRLRTSALAELTVGEPRIYKVDNAGEALTDVQNAGSTVTNPDPEPEPDPDPEPTAKVIKEFTGDQYAGGKKDTENKTTILEGGNNGEFTGLKVSDLTAGTVYKMGLYFTMSEIKSPDWTIKVRPQTEYYFLTQNQLVYDAAKGGTQKVIISVPFKAAGTEVELNSILEGFVGTIDKVVLATNDYDFGKDQGDYKLAAEYGREELKDAVHPEYPRYEGSQLDAGDPGKEGEGWKASTKADKPVDPDKPDPEPNPEGILLSLNGSQAAVHTDAILFTEAMHKANIKGDSYDFTNAVGRELYGFYMDAAKPVKDTTYKMAFYLTLTGIEEGKEGSEFKFRPANEYYYNLTNEELYNTEVGGTQKVIVSVPVKYTGERLEGYIWNTGGLKGTLDKVVLADANYDFGVKTDDYAMISEDIANAGSNKDAMTPAEGSWKPSTVEEVKAADDNNNGNNGDNGNNDNNDNNNGNNDNNGNNGNNGDVVNPGDNNNPVTGAVGVAAGTVMLAAAAAATLVLTKKRK